MTMRCFPLVICCLFLGVFQSYAQESLRVLPEKVGGVSTSDMMHCWLFEQVDHAVAHWRDEYEKRTKPEQIAAYQTQRRQAFLDAIGGLTQRTPLHARVTGRINRPGFCVEKIIFESQPKHFVTAALFLPDSSMHKPPYHAVLIPCGHAIEGKAYPDYQRVAILAAMEGLAALIFDPFEQGERMNLLDEKGHPRFVGSAGHTMLGIPCIPLGRGAARFEIWDGIRVMDYLDSRSDILPGRFGCTGNSGGGTQTTWLMALDDRVFAAVPTCSISTGQRFLQHMGADDAEQNLFGQWAVGLDTADLFMMTAPRPKLIGATTHDGFPIDGAWQVFRDVKRLYTRLGFSERIDLIEVDAEHGFFQPLRESSIRWMLRWLVGRDEPITEPEDLPILSQKEIQCTPYGQVMLLDGARSVYDLNLDFENELAIRRKELWTTHDQAEMLNRIRQLSGIRSLAKLAEPTVESIATMKHDGMTVEKLVFQPEEGIWLPALRFMPNDKASGSVLYLHEQGKAAAATSGGAIEGLVKQGKVVLAVDLRGIGETRQTKQARSFFPGLGGDPQDIFTAYQLGRSYVGMRAEDVLVVARWLAKAGE